MNQFVKVSIKHDGESLFSMLLENGTFKDLTSNKSLDYTKIILPWIIIVLSVRMINNLSNYSIDRLVFHIEHIIQNLTDSKDKITTILSKDSNRTPNELFSIIEETILDFKLELDKYFEAGEYSKIIDKKEIYLDRISTFRYVIESYIGLRNLSEAGNLIETSYCKFFSSNDKLVLDFLKGRMIRRNTPLCIGSHMVGYSIVKHRI